MSDVSLRREHEAALAAGLRAVWEQAHGTLSGQVHALAGPDSVAAWIEGALNPAERAMIRGAEGQQLVQQYANQLLLVILPDLRARLEAITGCSIMSGSVCADVDTGHVLCFFVLGQQRARVDVSGEAILP